MKEELVYTQKITLGYQHFDFSGHWKLADMFKQLSDLATTHAQKLGVYRLDMAQNYGWVVSKIRLRILKPLKNEDTLSMVTWASEGSRVIFPRYYQIKDSLGNLCAEGVGLWTLLDLQKRRIAMPSRAGIIFPENLPEPLEIKVATDFSDEQGYTFIENRQVRYSDVDTNQHLNNARYIEWVCDILDSERFKQHYIADLSVYFKKETAPNEVLSLEMKEDGDWFYVRGLKDGELHFAVEGQWQKY